MRWSDRPVTTHFRSVWQSILPWNCCSCRISRWTIYTPVAKQLGKNTAAVSRQIVRLCNLCWDAMLEAGEVEQYLGKPIRDLRAPNEMIFYLAFLVHFDKPFYHVVQHVPTLLF